MPGSRGPAPVSNPGGDADSRALPCGTERAAPRAAADGFWRQTGESCVFGSLRSELGLNRDWPPGRVRRGLWGLSGGVGRGVRLGGGSGGLARMELKGGRCFRRWCGDGCAGEFGRGCPGCRGRGLCAGFRAGAGVALRRGTEAGGGGRGTLSQRRLPGDPRGNRGFWGLVVGGFRSWTAGMWVVRVQGRTGCAVGGFRRPRRRLQGGGVPRCLHGFAACAPGTVLPETMCPDVRWGQRTDRISGLGLPVKPSPGSVGREGSMRYNYPRRRRQDASA